MPLHMIQICGVNIEKVHIFGESYSRANETTVHKQQTVEANN